MSASGHRPASGGLVARSCKDESVATRYKQLGDSIMSWPPSKGL